MPPNESTEQSDRSVHVAPSELAAFTVAIVLLVALEVFGTRSVVALTRPLWLDEIHTVLLAQGESLQVSLRDLAAGADFNPPTLYVLYRVVGALVGGLSELSMRLVATACVVGALPLVYSLLQRDCQWDAAAIGALAVWAQPVVIGVAFDARFYGPWLLGTALLLVSVRDAISSRPTRLTPLWLALASAFVCTIHYFGIVSWGAALGVAMWRARGQGIAMIRRLGPAAAGPVALAACIPLYFGQRSTLTVPTWIPPASLGDHLFLLMAALLPIATVVALVGWGASRLAAPLSRGRQPVARLSPLRDGTWLLLGQAGVPLALAMFSLFVQPATQPRYWIVGALATGAVAAIAAARTQRVVRWAVGFGIIVISATIVKGEGAAGEASRRRLQDDIAKAQRGTADGLLLVVRRRHTLYPLVRALPTLSAKTALLDGSEFAGREQRFSIVERDVARVHWRLFGFPRVVTPAELSGGAPFYLLETDSTRTPSAAEFPRFGITEVAPRLFRLQHHGG